MNKHEADEYIKLLAEKYPACFFEIPKHRRPLKEGIIDDLRVRERTWDEYAMAQVLEFYTSHWGYLYAMKAGVPRIDLDGNPGEKNCAQAGTPCEAAAPYLRGSDL